MLCGAMIHHAMPSYKLFLIPLPAFRAHARMRAFEFKYIVNSRTHVTFGIADMKRHCRRSSHFTPPALYFVTVTPLMPPENSNEVSSIEPLFRPLKRRKFYRKRANEDDIETTGDGSTPTLPSSEPSQENEGDTSESAKLDIAEILRLRKLRYRRSGIEFTVARPPGSGSGTPQPSADEDAEMTPEEVKKVVNRFAPQTGQVMDVNKHM